VGVVRVGGAEEELADAGFEVVAADDGVGGGGGVVVEGEVELIFLWGGDG